MEQISVTHNTTIFATNHNNNRPQKRSKKTHLKPTRLYGHSLIIKNYKQSSSFQDFQDYAKPSRLLPSKEVEFRNEALASLRAARSGCLFKVVIRTSNMYGSNMSDASSGVLLCLIDQNRSSTLHRIPVVVDKVGSETLCFQRGSVDEFTFVGPDMTTIEAVWVGVESGQWRLDGLSLTVIGIAKHPGEGSEVDEVHYSVLQYEFNVDDVLLGEGSDISMVELRPTLISQLSGDDPLTLLSSTPSQSRSPNPTIANTETESMRVYADLKLSLLSYDAALILIGTTVASFSAGENAAFAFFVGGAVGFLYLLLLQRSVDGLPASISPSTNTSGVRLYQLFKGFKGPLSSLALVVGASLVALKLSSISGGDDAGLVLTPKEILFGMLGFLACKVSVVLAAFKPMTFGSQEND